MKVSFEFFPPKTPHGQELLNETAKTLSVFNPDYFSVTYGAGGTTREGTLNAVSALQKVTTAPIVPHLTCISSTRDSIVEILAAYKKLGAKKIVALRGDLPLDATVGELGELHYASDLVKLMRDTSGDHFNIQVAAYPEIHPQAKTAYDDILSLKRKYEAGANGAITQYFFNPEAYFCLLDECARERILMPIVPGIMPITNFAKLAVFSDRCGAEIPRWIRSRLESYGNDEESIKAFGLEIVFNLCQRLIKGGAPALHIYTLNHSEASVALMNLLKQQGLLLEPIKQGESSSL